MSKRIDVLKDALKMAQRNIRHYGKRLKEKPKDEITIQLKLAKERKKGKILKQMIAEEEAKAQEKVVNPISFNVGFIPRNVFNNRGIKWYPDKMKVVDHEPR